MHWLGTAPRCETETASSATRPAVENRDAVVEECECGNGGESGGATRPVGKRRAAGGANECVECGGVAGLAGGSGNALRGRDGASSPSHPVVVGVLAVVVMVEEE
eukprot:Hpha_TRINITY_DN36947_c0_g1::TRINITY_DN36947_c0_g1_i1::g.170906::m.170906